MQYRQLGRSGLKISPICLGTMMFGGPTDEATSCRIIAKAREAGINFIDSADAYNGGQSEVVVGRAISNNRQNWIVATKLANQIGDDPNRGGLSRRWVMQAAEESLRRLGTDHIDIYYLHKEDHATPLQETVRAMGDLIRQGKIRYFGVSNYAGWQLMKMLSLADRLALPRPVTHQVYYTLTDRDFEWELMPLGIDQNVGTLVWSPLAGAKLSGKVGRSKAAPADSRAATDASWDIPTERLFAVTDVLETLSAELGHSIPQIALAWLLSRPTISSIVIGARNLAQLQDNLAATQVQLSEAQIARLDAASAVRPPYPYWHQRRTFLRRNPPPV